jgi:hypothetical protein
MIDRRGTTQHKARGYLRERDCKAMSMSIVNIQDSDLRGRASIKILATSGSVGDCN